MRCKCFWLGADQMATCSRCVCRRVEAARARRSWEITAGGRGRESVPLQDGFAEDEGESACEHERGLRRWGWRRECGDEGLNVELIGLECRRQGASSLSSAREEKVDWWRERGGKATEKSSVSQMHRLSHRSLAGPSERRTTTAAADEGWPAGANGAREAQKALTHERDFSFATDARWPLKCAMRALLGGVE